MCVPSPLPPPGGQAISSSGFKLTSPNEPKVQRGVVATPNHVDQMTERHGWFREPLMVIEAALWGRWPYWVATVLNHRLGPLPEWAIPQIPFGPISGGSRIAHSNPKIVEMVETAEEAKKRVFKAFGDALRTGDNLSDLLAWWLYAFGSPTVTEQPKLTDEGKVAMYSGLNLGWLLGHPGDWGAILCLEFLGPDRRGGWFPTPINVAKMMTEMTLGVGDGDKRTLSVNDPCVGTGVFLLCASNYSLNLSGQDINRTMCLACEFNGWLFVPWLVYGQHSVRELRPQTPSPQPTLETNSPQAPPKVRVTQDRGEQQGCLFDTNQG